ncbi:MAG: SDR family oxidoreductase [Ignavibacteria bacterium]|nr:SDR family oxidoreductase [Ignavibacteria bacterium]
MPTSPRLILLTGATGYIGGRLLRRFEEAGERVRCLARRPAQLAARVGGDTEIAQGDVLDAASLGAAMRGVDTAYYLVHSMGDDRDFETLDRIAAENFGAAAREAGVRRIVYLGGLGSSAEALSSHLRSRQQVGRVLAASGVQVIELRASIVIGSGSLSFEMIRALVERLPVMITPRWVSVKAQPIGIADLLAYLALALDVRADGNRVYEIGAADRLSYGDLMREYARQRGLRRVMIPVPVLTPRLSSLWLGLVTPLYARVGRKLAESLKHPTVVEDQSALADFPLRPKSVRDAIADALRNEDREFAETRWSDALSSAGIAPGWGGTRFGNRLLDQRSIRVACTPARAFAPIQRIGGETGWYWGNWLWRLRGFADILAGGVGMRRGRRHPVDLCVGDAVDWWRVEVIEPGVQLRLFAEMKVPGRAWLEYQVTPDGDGAVIRQTAIFDPVGLAGILYWYGIYPVHALVFRGMLRGIARIADCGFPISD